MHACQNGRKGGLLHGTCQNGREEKRNERGGVFEWHIARLFWSGYMKAMRDEGRIMALCCFVLSCLVCCMIEGCCLAVTTAMLGRELMAVSDGSSRFGR